MMGEKRTHINLFNGVFMKNSKKKFMNMSEMTEQIENKYTYYYKYFIIYSFAW